MDDKQAHPRKRGAYSAHRTKAANDLRRWQTDLERHHLGGMSDLAMIGYAVRMALGPRSRSSVSDDIGMLADLMDPTAVLRATTGANGNTELWCPHCGRFVGGSVIRASEYCPQCGVRFVPPESKDAQNEK